MWMGAGIALGWLLGGGSVMLSIILSLGSASMAVLMVEAYAATYAAVLGPDGLTITGPYNPRGPKTDVQIPYGALVEVEDLGKKLRLGYHIDPFLFGDPPTHHATIEPEDKDALLRALQQRMDSAHRHHLVDRAQNRYRRLLPYIVQLVLVGGGSALLAVVAR
jgi:hypothetical protein